MVIKNINIDLHNTITCGQIFRFEENTDNSYTVILSDRVVNLKMNGNDLIVKSNIEDNLREIITNYLGLNVDYDSMNNYLIKNDKSLKELIDNSKGFKIMKTPKFETIISYIISANNKVSQITKVLNNISEKYGSKVEFDGKYYYLFPSVEQMRDCTKESLRELKTGFRDEYIYELVNKILNNEFDIDYIDKLDTISSLNYLKENKGIGDKVASCILLFAYQRYDVFPIDTWVKKYMLDKYNLKTLNEIKKYSQDKFGIYCGYFIQLIFNYNRNKS